MGVALPGGEGLPPQPVSFPIPEWIKPRAAGEEYAVPVGDRFPTEIDGAALSVRFDRIQLPLVLFTTMSSRSVASIPFRLNPVTKALDLCRSSGAASAPTSLVLLHA